MLCSVWADDKVDLSRLPWPGHPAYDQVQESADDSPAKLGVLRSFRHSGSWRVSSTNQKSSARVNCETSMPHYLRGFRDSSCMLEYIEAHQVFVRTHQVHFE